MTDTKKNPAAVALGRLGGLKGGPARAKKMSAKERSRISRLGGLARAKQRARDAVSEALEKGSDGRLLRAVRNAAR